MQTYLYCLFWWEGMKQKRMQRTRLDGDKGNLRGEELKVNFSFQRKRYVLLWPRKAKWNTHKRSHWSQRLVTDVFTDHFRARWKPWPTASKSYSDNDEPEDSFHSQRFSWSASEKKPQNIITGLLLIMQRFKSSFLGSLTACIDIKSNLTLLVKHFSYI